MSDKLNQYIKKYEKSLTNYKSVKTSLNSIIKNKENIVEINKIVIVVNKLITHTYIFLKLYCIYMYDKNKEQIPVINVKLIKSIIKIIGSKDNRGTKPSKTTQLLMKDLQDFYDKEYKQLLNNNDKLSFTHLNTLLDYEAVDIITNIENHIKEHYTDFLFRYINVKLNKKNMEKQIKEDFSNVKLRKRTLTGYRKILRQFKNDLINQTNKCQLFNDLRQYIIKNIFPENITTESIQKQIETNPYLFVNGMIKMNREIEKLGNTTFNCFPIRRSCIPKYIRLDTTILIHILFPKELNKNQYLTKGNTKIYQSVIWSMFFRTERKVFKDKSYTFNNSIVTDGFGCSILFIKNSLYNPLKRVKPKVYRKPFNYSSDKYLDTLTIEEKETYDSKCIIAIDPGKEDLIYATNGYKNDKGKLITFRYSQNQRRKEIKSKKYMKMLDAIKLTRKVNDKTIKEIESSLTGYDSKTSVYELFKSYIKKKNEVNDLLYKYYEEELHRKLKWYSYINKQKSESWMINNFKQKFGDEKNTVICIGDYSQQYNMKHKEPTKGKSIRKLFKRAGYKLFLINEYNTSKKSFIDGSDMEKFRIRSNPKPWLKYQLKQVHGLLRSKNVTENNNNPKHILVNRDMNGSMNILKKAICIMYNIPIPDYLCKTN